MQFRLIDTGFNTPSMNMAIDEALLSSKQPVLRFYQWKPAGLSIGYNQKISEINAEFCTNNNIDIVRRITGGKAVLHDEELTYSFICPSTMMPNSITESYKEISKGLLSALKSIGLNADMNKDVENKQGSAICFQDPSWYEVLADNKKIIGSAQRRIDGKLLQHGAILIDMDIEKYANCFKNSDEKTVEKLKERITSIRWQKKSNVDTKEIFLKENDFESESEISKLKKALISGFEKELKIQFKESTLTEEEQDLAEKLDKEKYSKDWMEFHKIRSNPSPLSRN